MVISTVCNWKCRLKNSWKSLTVWFNGIMIAMLPFADHIAAVMMDWMPQLTPYLGETLAKNVGLFVVVMNILLRFRTKSDLAQK